MPDLPARPEPANEVTQRFLSDRCREVLNAAAPATPEPASGEPDLRAAIKDALLSHSESDVYDAADLTVAEVAKWLRARCCHGDEHWGFYDDPAKCHYPLCNAARDLEARS